MGPFKHRRAVDSWRTCLGEAPKWGTSTSRPYSSTSSSNSCWQIKLVGQVGEGSSTAPGPTARTWTTGRRRVYVSTLIGFFKPCQLVINVCNFLERIVFLESINDDLVWVKELPAPSKIQHVLPWSSEHPLPFTHFLTTYHFFSYPLHHLCTRVASPTMYHTNVALFINGYIPPMIVQIRRCVVFFSLLTHLMNLTSLDGIFAEAGTCMFQGSYSCWTIYDCSSKQHLEITSIIDNIYVYHNFPCICQKTPIGTITWFVVWESTQRLQFFSELLSRCGQESNWY